MLDREAYPLWMEIEYGKGTMIDLRQLAQRRKDYIPMDKLLALAVEYTRKIDKKMKGVEHEEG